MLRRIRERLVKPAVFVRVPWVRAAASYGLVAWLFVRFLGPRGLWVLWLTQFGRALVPVRLPGGRFTVFLRPRTVDRVTFREVFIEGLYEFDGYEDPAVIVDAGANVGFASVYFAMRFPAARIIAVEPEPENARIARRNVAQFPTVTIVEAALLSEKGWANVRSRSCNEDSFQFSASCEATPGAVSATTIGALSKAGGLEHIDILKMDIEGAEREVLASSDEWLSRVSVLAIELHEQLAPGVQEVFERTVLPVATRIHRKGSTTFVAFR